MGGFGTPSAGRVHLPPAAKRGSTPARRRVARFAYQPSRTGTTVMSREDPFGRILTSLHGAALEHGALDMHDLTTEPGSGCRDDDRAGETTLISSLMRPSALPHPRYNAVAHRRGRWHGSAKRFGTALLHTRATWSVPRSSSAAMSGSPASSASNCTVALSHRVPLRPLLSRQQQEQRPRQSSARMPDPAPVPAVRQPICRKPRHTAALQQPASR